MTMADTQECTTAPIDLSVYPGLMFIDTETNRLADFKLAADDPNNARLAALTMIITDTSFDNPVDQTFLVKPEGWEMDPEASAVNGLSTERLEGEGIHIGSVLDGYEYWIKKGYPVFAFGAQFDCKIMRGEFRRAGRDDMFMATNNSCLMRAMTKPCNIPQANGRGLKWPKLSEAYQFVTGRPMQEQHVSLSDTRAALEIARWAHKNGALIPPSVHRAKGRE